MLKLRITHENGETAEHRYTKRSTLVGRAASNDLQLDVDGVSRNHARFRVKEKAVFLEDLESTNGTFVNDTSVSSRSVTGEDIIRIGSVTIVAEFEDCEEIETEAEPAYSAESGAPEPAVSESPVLESSVSDSIGPGTGSAEDHQAAGTSGEAFYWESLRRFLLPVWPFIEDDSVSEIMINGPDTVYIERKGELRATDARFTKDQLAAAVLNIAQYVGRRIGENEPYLDARLPDGSRVAVLLPPCSRRGTSIAIRKFAKERLTLDKLIEFGSLSADMVTFLRACVVLKKNIIISGGTSSGKTSLLNVISGLIPVDERIITIEDSAELQLDQEHVVPLETKPPDSKGRGQMTIRDLVRASLRMRPDRIIVGEIRGGEALDLLQAMNTGHSGSKATVHASSPIQALSRLETLALFSGIEIPIQALREQVSTAIDFVVQASRLPDRSRKITHISQVSPLSSDRSYQVEDIFRFVHAETREGRIIGTHQWSGVMPSIVDEMKIAGLVEAAALFDA